MPRRCAPGHVPGWTWFALLFLGCGLTGGLLFSVVLWAHAAYDADPEPYLRLLAAATLFGGAGLAAIPWVLRDRAARRLAALHPRHAELADAGFGFRAER